MASIQLGLDYIGDDNLTGYRLDRIEILNWGTFNGKVWTLRLGGRNTLLTGDIGTGKSTLVDAVTTLLVPAQRIAYNKAAGAATRERTLRSYVMGYFKAARGGSDQASARPVALRGLGSYSVVLGVFRNVGFTKSVTLAQVFWMAENRNQPRRFYVAAERELSIAEDFSQFGPDINQLRRRLRKKRINIWDSFPGYGAWFRRRFGIHHEQALELFHQTVSMKSVGNLTDFVRRHMLERLEVASKIDALIAHFDDLTHAHEAVLKAKRQISLLRPLVDKCKRYAELEEQLSKLRNCQGALAIYFAVEKLKLLESQIALLRADKERQAKKLELCRQQCNECATKIADLRVNLAAHGGDRLNQIDAEVLAKRTERDRRQVRATRYAELLRRLNETEPESEEVFVAQKRRLTNLHDQILAEKEDLRKKIDELNNAIRGDQARHDAVSAEVASLESRDSNIPARQIALRSQLCMELDLDEAAIPFAGEVISVDKGASEWEGAVERLLREFGLSLLVDNAHYPVVVEWVDRNQLQQDLLYLRVRVKWKSPTVVRKDSIVRKLSFKRESVFANWIKRELGRQFDLTCCSSQEQFMQERSAITCAGHIKQSGNYHRKNDEYSIHDRSRYVLGWTNKAKLKTLKAEGRSLEKQLAVARNRLNTHLQRRNTVTERTYQLSELQATRDYDDIDWRTLTGAIQELIDERKELESLSDVIAHLKGQLQAAIQKEADLMNEQGRLARGLGALDERLTARIQERSNAGQIIAGIDLDGLSDELVELKKISRNVASGMSLTLESCDQLQSKVSMWLGKQIDLLSKKAMRARERIIGIMKDYNNEYSLETSEIDASVEAAGEYYRMLEKLEEDDLPSFESRFKQLLNENTIREIANFQARLDRERQSIRERIEKINKSLGEIPYNPRRYIRLVEQKTTDQQVNDFKTDLRACTEGSLTGSEDDQYSEAKFLQVKEVIERFRGREGESEIDRRWTRKVTDVRNWFVFGASERWSDSDEEYEHYSDSSGKSGGQKEKLAYTILAASLTYQFGLKRGVIRSQSFRFVVIDEAFGRGSDESSRFALNLFSKLNLQLLIVTPLQKIYVIEPFVESVGFVDIQDDCDSRLRNLSIKEYREEKERALRAETDAQSAGDYSTSQLVQ